MDRITHLAVDGDITISFVQFDGASDPSVQSPSAAPESVASAPPLLMGGHYGEPYSSYPPQGHGQPGFVPPPYPTANMGAPPFPPQQPYMHASAQPLYPQNPPPGAYPVSHLFQINVF